MRLNTLEKLFQCLEDMSPKIEMNKKLIEKAYIPIKKMLEMSQ